jgi:hypothetical protein
MFKYVHGPDAGTKKIKFYISGDANTNTYLDLTGIKLVATCCHLTNSNGTRAKFLRPPGGLFAFLSRYRVFIGG